MAEKANIDDALLLQLWREGKSMVEMGKAFGVTDSCVSHRCMQLGLPRRRPGSYKVSALRCEALYKDGISTPKLAKIFGVSRGAIIRVLRSRGIEVKTKTVLDDPRTAVCVRLHRKGLTAKEISKIMNMHHNLVSARIRRVLGSQPHGGRRRTSA